MSKATEKIKAELGGITGQKENVIKSSVADALILFCEQNEEFDRAIEQSDKTFKHCIAWILRGIGTSISDIEAYRRAVEFYFPGAKIDMTMTIRMSEFEESASTSSHDINLSLLDCI